MKEHKSQAERSAQTTSEGLITVPTVHAFEKVLRQLENLKEIIIRCNKGPASRSEDRYIEPGPNAPRKYFTPAELMKRWGWGKTKVYQIPENELPYWKKGQLKRYFWAHVHAYEGRISWEEARQIYEQHKQERED